MTHSNNTQEGEAMGEQERLLSDEETIGQLRIIAGYNKTSPFPMGDNLLTLIKEQRQAWAAYCIGTDDRDHMNMNGNLNVVKKRIYRNELRGEQRERNKL